MKSIITSLSRLIIPVLAVFCVFTSCSESAEDEPVTPAPKSRESYTIMLYMSASSLDNYSAHYVTQAIYHGLPDSVNMVVEMKPTAARNCKTLNGTVRFDIADQAELKGSETMPHTIQDYVGSLDILDQNVKNVEMYGDTLVKMNTGEELCKFMMWAKEKHPADHYILITMGHGTGWTTVFDGMSDGADAAAQSVGTRASLCDSFIDGGNSYLSLDQMTGAISKAMGGQHLDLLYCNNCLMGCLENYTAYADVADYVIGTCEPTIAYGINTAKFLDQIDKVCSGEQSLYDSMKDYVDYACSKEWWDMADNLYVDINVTDLSKMAGVNAAFKQFADFMAENYSKASSSTGVLNSFEDAIPQTLTNCFMFAGQIVAVGSSTIQLIRQAEDEGVFIPESMPKYDDVGMVTLDGYAAYYFLKWLTAREDQQPTKEGFEAWREVECMGNSTFYMSEYVAADYMLQVANQLQKDGLTDLAAQALEIRNTYLEALRDACHIAATGLGDNDPYEVASFSVNINAAGPATYSYIEAYKQAAEAYAESGYEDFDVLNMIRTYYGVVPPYYTVSNFTVTQDMMLGFYQHLRFDKATGWSRVFSYINNVANWANTQDRFIRDHPYTEK